MKFYFSPKKILVLLLIIIFILIISNILGILLHFNYHNRVTKHIFQLTNFDDETSLSTFFSSLILIISSGLLYVISRFKKQNKKNLPWIILSAIFLFLSIDESISIHEKLIVVFREYLNVSGLLYFAWVIPYGILLIIFIILYIPFLIKLEKNTRNLFILSGIVFVSGAIGIELFEGQRYELNGEDFGFAIYYTIEESLEMLGISIFIYSLLKFISKQDKVIEIRGQIK